MIDGWAAFALIAFGAITAGSAYVWKNELDSETTDSRTMNGENDGD